MKISKIITVIIFGVLFSPLTGVAREQVAWLTAHWPPLMELDESRRHITGGQRGVQLKMLQASLTQYNHINEEMPWSRFWYIVKKGDKVCNCMAIKTREREAIAQFSIPISVALPSYIIMRKETFGQLGSPDALSLIDLMQDKRFSGILIKKRSYSNGIDEILQKQETGSNITRSFIDVETSIKMLARNRMDYILEYPFVITRTVDRSLPDLKDMFVHVPIREIAPFYFIYVACPKNEWGREMIRNINDALKKLRPTEPFRAALGLTYTGKNLETILKFYDTRVLGVNE